MNLDRSKIFATPEELETIKKNWKEACNAPVITFSIGKPDLASICRRNVIESIDSLAIKHGLPSKSKFWGMDLQTGEFVYDNE